MSTFSNNTATAVIRLNGRFDFNCYKNFSSQYETLIDDPAVRTIDVNFAQVEYIDSSALGMLLLLRDKAAEKQKTVRISQPKGMVKEIMDIANLQKKFEFLG